MTDVKSVRAEIKQWEHVFKTKYGRAPSVDDIKRDEQITSKYKLYKKLSKSSSESNNEASHSKLNPPSTPPRPSRGKETASTILARTPRIERTAPLSTFNPFSPQKKAPTKPLNETRSASSHVKAREGGLLFPKVMVKSPDPFSQPSSTPSKLSFDLPSAPGTAVSRARKRLRGEPVSPSPNKDKRRRVSSQISVPFSRSRQESPSEDEEEPLDADSSFVDNSPVKPMTGRSFSLLFEDSFAGPTKLFDSAAPSNDRLAAGAKKGKARAQKKAPGTMGWKSTIAETAETLGQSALLSDNSASSGPISRTSSKRPLSDADEDTESLGTQEPIRSRSPLLPPSPPPASQSTWTRPKSKKPGKGRKKMKIDSQQDEDETDESDSIPKLKVASRFHARGSRSEGLDDDIGPEPDPILGYTRFTAPHASPPPTTSSLQDDDVTIDLPDKLRRLLALPTTKSQASNEERVVQGLLYGRKVTQYDPSKGGEIWDVGENSELMKDESMEGDEWEGEPVPWEVGEL